MARPFSPRSLVRPSVSRSETSATHWQRLIHVMQKRCLTKRLPAFFKHVNTFYRVESGQPIPLPPARGSGALISPYWHTITLYHVVRMLPSTRVCMTGDGPAAGTVEILLTWIDAVLPVLTRMTRAEVRVVPGPRPDS